MERTYNAALHRFAVFTAGATFLLLIAGALVTSNDAGLAVPDWPLSYGSLLPPMVGGILYEHGHRMVASFVGLCTIVLATWLWRAETHLRAEARRAGGETLRRAEARRGVRWLGVAALGTVIAQGVLGGLTVLFYLPAAISAAHATLAQLFFGTVVSLALFTSRWWQSGLTPVSDSGHPSLRTLASASVAAIFFQLILGAALRHKASGFIPHIIGAAVVTWMIFWSTGAVRKRRLDEVPALARSAGILRGLLIGQLVLGGAALWARIAAAEFPQPMPLLVTLTVAHTVAGALVLAAAVVLMLVSFRALKPTRVRVASASQEQVAPPVVSGVEP